MINIVQFCATIFEKKIFKHFPKNQYVNVIYIYIYMTLNKLESPGPKADPCQTPMHASEYI